MKTVKFVAVVLFLAASTMVSVAGPASAGEGRGYCSVLQPRCH
ncbi:MAG TPA: hypothetical protein VG943_05100 [Caulobacterales bacterium]|nr:hypothetical protein [Caulobacterales bacterium]